MPSTDQGYNSWDDGYLQGGTYLAGLAVPKLQAYKRTPHEGTLFGLRTHANTMIAHRLYHGVEAPRLRRGYDFSGTWVIWDIDLIKAIRTATGSGQSFLFSPLDRCTDTFDATSGETYKLTRSVARGTVSWVTSATHPDEILLDGVVDPTAATVSGQNVVANDTGVITVHYTPVYRVIGRLVSDDIPTNNGFDLNFNFEEFVTF